MIVEVQPNTNDFPGTRHRRSPSHRLLHFGKRLWRLLAQEILQRHHSPTFEEFSVPVAELCGQISAFSIHQYSGFFHSHFAKANKFHSPSSYPSIRSVD